MTSFNFVDRQQASVGSSEKSQKVHSANWKEEVHLRKEIESLKKQEDETVNRIFIDQRIVAHQFRCRITRSIDLITAHEKLKEDLIKFQETNRQTLKTSRSHQGNHGDLNTAMRRSKSQLSERRRQTFSNTKHRTAKDFQDDKSSPIRRPVTASAARGRAWEQRIDSMARNLQRAKSAPISRKTKCNGVVEEYSCIRKHNKSSGVLKRASTAAIVPVNPDKLERNRTIEVARQREAILKFIKGIEHLQLRKTMHL